MAGYPIRRTFLIIALLCCVFFIILFIMARMRIGPSTSLGMGEKVGVVEVEGYIGDSRATVDLVRDFVERDDIKAIILRINSPGGEVAPSQEVYRELLKARGHKHIVASLGSVAASGGYYMACAADVIVANPGTMTGSIGVLFKVSNLEELFEKIGIDTVVVKSGRFKDIGSPNREMTEAERALVQDVIDDVHDQFIEAIVDGRGIDESAVREVADGRFFSGRQAMEMGLVDELGNFEDAVMTTAAMAGIEGRPGLVYPKKKRRRLVDFLVEEMLQTFLNKVETSEFRLVY